MHINSAQGNYTSSHINFFSSIQKGKNSILVKLLPSYVLSQYSGKFTLYTNAILFLKLEIWDVIVVSIHSFQEIEGTSYNNTAMVLISNDLL